jgi:hypothetical protein
MSKLGTKRLPEKQKKIIQKNFFIIVKNDKKYCTKAQNIA